MCSSGTTSFAQMIQRSTCSRSEGKRRVWRIERTAHDLMRTNSSWCLSVGVFASQWNWLSCIDCVTADKGSKMNSEVYSAMLSAHIQSDAPNTLQMNSISEAYLESSPRFFKAKNLFCNGHVSHPSPISCISPPWRQY